MAALVWVTMGIAIWHFAVFVPDRFWSGIVGAFLGSMAGAMISGAAYQLATGDSIGQTDVVTAVAAIPGAILGMGVVYTIGIRSENARTAS